MDVNRCSFEDFRAFISRRLSCRRWRGSQRIRKRCTEGVKQYIDKSNTIAANLKQGNTRTSRGPSLPGSVELAQEPKPMDANCCSFEDFRAFIYYQAIELPSLERVAADLKACLFVL